MERIRKALKRRASVSYEPLNGNAENEHISVTPKSLPFSWLEYSIFLLLGIAMLWAWNMFLVAFPYFQSRFASNPWLLTHFPSAILSTSTVTNFLAMILLTHLQRHANYPQRITISLLLNISAFTLLALSTVFFSTVSPRLYFAFIMIVVFSASLAAALCQNGIFAYAGSLGKGEYTQGIMTGQAVAGVLPCIAQIVSVLSVPKTDAGPGPGQESPKSAFAYFMTATGISSFALFAFSILIRRHGVSETKSILNASIHDNDDEPTERKVVRMRTLFSKLRWLAFGVSITFATTMLFPVFTQEIFSVRASDPSSPRLLHDNATFIALAFLCWNTGDLTGRLLTLIPSLAALTRRPRMVFLLSVLRVGYVPLYLLCNIRGRGAVVVSDAFYLLGVQFLFGVSNGYLGSVCMIGAGLWVEPEEREAAGSFMGLMLCGGLTMGSLLSFSVA